jgi:hypothetical protein
MELGSISVESKRRNMSFFPLNSKRAKPYATSVLDMIVKSEVGSTSRNELVKNLVKVFLATPFQPSRYASKLKLSGSKFTPAKISVFVLKLAKNIHTRG